MGRGCAVGLAEAWNVLSPRFLCTPLLVACRVCRVCSPTTTNDTTKDNTAHDTHTTTQGEVTDGGREKR
jgi:hypothetical protein